MSTTVLLSRTFMIMEKELNFIAHSDVIGLKMTKLRLC